MPTDQPTPDSAAPGSASPTAEEVRVVQVVLAAIRRMRYGSIQVVVQDGHVIQIETTEKTRLQKSR